MVKAFSVALYDFPRFNSLYFPEEKPYELQVMPDHNMSIAIDTPIGLVAPNIKQVQHKSIREIQQEIIRLRDLALQGHLGRNELFGGSVALSNVGTIGGITGTPLNLPNQSCIVGMGKIREMPKIGRSYQHEGRTLYDIEARQIVHTILTFS